VLSDLYRAAVAKLNATERKAWADTARRMKKVKGPHPVNQSGRDAVFQVMSERQLSSAPQAAEPSLMTGLILAMANAAWPNPADAVSYEAMHKEITRPFRLKGQRIRSAPAVLIRYWNGPGTLGYLIQSAENSGCEFAGELRELFRAADDETRPETWHDVVDFLKETDVWEDLPLSEVAMSGSASVFVTFDAGQHTERDDADWMHAALALWRGRHDCFIELHYQRDAVDALLFPTLADAGWFRYFRSVGTDSDHGLTAPHGPDMPAQPEAVHPPAMMTVLDSPDRLRLVPVA